MVKLAKIVWETAARIIYPIYLAVNMLVCALLFFPHAQARETVSGLLGRWLTIEKYNRKNTVARYAAPVIDFLHWDKDHCKKTHRGEMLMRIELYGSPDYPKDR